MFLPYFSVFLLLLAALIRAAPVENHSQQTSAEIANNNDDSSLEPRAESSAQKAQNVSYEHEKGKMPPKRPAPAQTKAKSSLTREMRPRQVFDELSSVEEDLVESMTMEIGDGRRLVRYAHRFGGMDVWDSSTTLVIDNFGLGGYIRSSGLSEKLRLNLAKKSLGRMNGRSLIIEADDSDCRLVADFRVKESTSKRYIYEIPEENGGGVTIADLFDLRGDTNSTGVPNQLYCLYNSLAGKVIKYWKGIQPFVGDGGNVKIGKYRYGSSREKLPSTQLPGSTTNSSKTCRMTTSNGYVAVWDLKSSTNRVRPGGGTPISYDCTKGVSDATNGGYGPSADCFYYADKTVSMLMDDEWGAAQRIDDITPVKTITVGVHYGSKYDNAFWDGYGLHMGDGNTLFYSSCSCYDVMAHEIGHAVTAATSRLIYSGDSGCLNEAFSDMTGEVLKSYLKLKNDFKIAASCLKTKPYLRNLAEPMTMTQYKPPMEPHSCSAIFNYAFYKLATMPGWSVQSAYRAFIFANRIYWTAETNMTNAACDVVSVVQQLQLGNAVDVVTAFAAVKIDVNRCLSRSSPLPAGDGVIELKNCETASNLTAQTGNSLHFKVKIPETATKQWVTIQGKTGDADMYINIGEKATSTKWAWRPFWEGSNEYVNDPVQAGTAGSYYYIMLSASASFDDIQLYACYY